MVCNPVNDAMFVESLARQEQECEDAVLARRLAVSSGGIDQGLSQLLDQATANASSEESSMIHIACEIGECEAEILVDTGAEMSVMSEQLAGQLGLLSHLDRSMQGVASGVGQAKILGRLWGVPVKLGHVEFTLDFSVLSTQQQLLILGLDQMRRFKCLVDLEKGCLIFGGRDGVEVSFLTSARGRGRATSPISTVLIQGHRAAGMLKSRDPLAAQTTLTTLRTVLTNVANHPEDLKYRRLRGTNERLQREVLAHPEAVELLRLVGFVRDGDDLVLPAAAPLQALRMLCGAGGPLG